MSLCILFTLSYFLTSQESLFSSVDKADTAAEKLLFAAEEVEGNQSSAAPHFLLLMLMTIGMPDKLSSPSSTDEQLNGSESGSRSCSVEIEEYLTENNLGRTDSRFPTGLETWYLRLATLSRRYLSAPMASIAQES